MVIDANDWILDFDALNSSASARSLNLIAHHEAGHMAAAHISKMTLLRVTIRPEDDPTEVALGLANHCIPLNLRQRIESDLPFGHMMFRRMVMVTMAARLSEPLSPDYHRAKIGSLSDVIEEMSMAAWYVHGRDADWPVRVPPTAQMLTFLTEMKRRTVRMTCTERFRAAVIALAAELQVAGVLEGNRVAAIVTDALSRAL